MAKQVTLTIDGRQVTVPEGMLVVDAAKMADIDIPVFCYHPKMEPVGMCRMCLVEIGRPLMDRTTGKPILDEYKALIAQGFTNRQIADKLTLSIRTVESHRANLMEKLDLHSRTELIKFALRKGVIPD